MFNRKSEQVRTLNLKLSNIDKLKKQQCTNSSSSIQQDKHHFYIPICIGFGDEWTAEQLIAVVNFINVRGDTYTILKAPKDKSALEKWEQDTAEAWKIIPKENVMTIDEWRAQKAWEIGFQRYQKLRNGEDKKTLADKLKIDVGQFKERWIKNHPQEKEMSDEDVEMHVHKHGADMFSFAADARGEVSGPQKNVLLLNHLFKTMGFVLSGDIQEKMGYRKHSLLHLTFSFEEVFVEKNTTQPNKLDGDNRKDKDKKEILTDFGVKLAQAGIPPNSTAQYLKSLFEEFFQPNKLKEGDVLPPLSNKENKGIPFGIFSQHKNGKNQLSVITTNYSQQPVTEVSTNSVKVSSSK